MARTRKYNQARRNELARAKGYRNYQAMREAQAGKKGFMSYATERKAKELKAAAPYSNLTDKEKAAWHKSFRALKQMEKGMSLSRAAEQEHTTPGIVRKFAGDQLQQRGRRWVLSSDYNQSRALKVKILTEDGIRVVTVSDPATRSEYARYLSYVGMYFSYDPNIRQKGINGIREFEGRTFKDSKGQEHPYITDRKLLIELQDAGKTDLEGYYPKDTK
jgi:hypothetical protein